MPTVLRSGPYRFYWYSHEPGEPPHVHVDRGEKSTKFWLNPRESGEALARNFGFSARELGRQRWSFGIHWPDPDDDLSTEGLLRGETAARGFCNGWIAS